MTATTLARPPVSTAARMLLDRSRAGLLQACAARTGRRALRRRAPRRAAGRRCGAGRPGAAERPGRSPQRLGDPAPGRSRTDRVGRLLRGDRLPPGRGRGRPRRDDHRARGRRPAAGRRELPPRRGVLARAAPPAGAAGRPAVLRLTDTDPPEPRMTRPFTHLHVASGYSLRYGASTPAALVEVARRARDGRPSR